MSSLNILGKMKICGVDTGLTTCFAIIDFAPEKVTVLDIKNYNLLHNSIPDRTLLWKRLFAVHKIVLEIMKDYQLNLVSIENIGPEKSEKPYKFESILEKDRESLRRLGNSYFQQAVESFSVFGASVWSVPRRYEFEVFLNRKVDNTNGYTEAYGKILGRELIKLTGLKGRDERDAVAAAMALGCFVHNCPIPKEIVNQWLIARELSAWKGRNNDIN